jgi:ATP phosphoribosyltransferase regulatory subunit
LEALRALPRLFGGGEIFQKARKVFGRHEIISYLEVIHKSLSYDSPNTRTLIDFGIINRSYYTGVIFKGYWQGYGAEVLSGGRYNDLIGNFGRQLPAVGFATNMNAILKMSSGVGN